MAAKIMPAFSLERKRRRKKLQKFLPKRCYLHGKSSTRSSSLKDVFFPSTTTATTTGRWDPRNRATLYGRISKNIQSSLKLFGEHFFKYLGYSTKMVGLSNKLFATSLKLNFYFLAHRVKQQQVSSRSVQNTTFFSSNSVTIFVRTENS